MGKEKEIVYEFGLSIGLGNAQWREEINVLEDWDLDEWNALTPEQQEKWLTDYLKDWASNYIETWFELKTEEPS